MDEELKKTHILTTEQLRETLNDCELRAIFSDRTETEKLCSLLRWIIVGVFFWSLFRFFGVWFGFLEETPAMTIRVDPVTQCEYLESSKGTLVPRMVTSGVHMGCKI